MNIKTNDDLRIAVNNAIKDSGITKTALANKLGITRQGFDKLLSKKSFSLDDANAILDILQMCASVEIKKYEIKKY